MLADLPILAQAGRLQPEVHLPGTARCELLDFIAAQLPQWRDYPERKPETSETALTDQLCSHLNSAARLSAGWSWIQFQREAKDEVRKERSIDLAPRPSGAVLVVEGRRHTQFDNLFPIECKRLSTPERKDRDNREYVVTASGSTGGIQRFKFGLHGASHRMAAMIGYVQERTSSYWLAEVNSWIRALSCDARSGWSATDCLKSRTDDTTSGLATLDSSHQRSRGLGEMAIRHLWVQMR